MTALPRKCPTRSSSSSVMKGEVQHGKEVYWAWLNLNCCRKAFLSNRENWQKADQGMGGQIQSSYRSHRNVASQGRYCDPVCFAPTEGQRYTRNGFNSRWQAARDQAIASFPELSFDFTFHDLKAKGISDLEGSLSEKQEISGHKSIGQTARYDRKTKIVPVVGGR